ncbi:MAG TPA: RpiB/LacA/LacB family sugar-phosphate isomerase [Tepidisphaeraceae bacterium]|jgi:ribose 5-phosphate isomerase B
MKVAIACDHRGFECKRFLLPALRSKGHEVLDLGCASAASCDYPDFAVAAATAIGRGEVEVAVLLDSSGIGMCVCANKIAGVRAGLVHDEVMARVARDANHCNAVCLGSDLLSQDQILKIVEAFLSTPFGKGRHLRRVGKISQLEQQAMVSPRSD